MLNSQILKIGSQENIMSVDRNTFPEIKDFSLLLEDNGTFGKHLFFYSETFGKILNFPWWDNVDHILRKKESNREYLGLYEKYEALEEGWHVIIFSDDNFIYCLQSDDVLTYDFYRWFKVDKKKYKQSWDKLYDAVK